MGRGVQRRNGRPDNGGILSLAEFANEHAEALNYDLLTRTCYQLDDVGGALSWGALMSFIKNLRTDSALARDLGKSTGWEDVIKTNEILADIFDLLQVININICRLGGGKYQKIKPYPRPGRDENKKRIGSGAMPANKLREWLEEKRHARR